MQEPEEADEAITPDTRSSSVQSVQRAAALLRALAAAPSAGARLKDVAAAVQLDQATVHRLLTTLVSVGLVEQDRSSKSYRLGLELFALASAASNRYDVQDVARASLERLAKKTGDTVLFYLRAGNDGICVDLETGDYPIKALPTDIGGRFPLGFGAAGIALLAPLPDSEIEQIVDKNRSRLMRFDREAAERLPEAIRSFREARIAYSERNGVPGIASISAPLLDRRGRPVAAIAIASIIDRLAEDRRPVLENQLATELDSIAKMMMRRPDALWQRRRWAASVASKMSKAV